MLGIRLENDGEDFNYNLRRWRVWYVFFYRYLGFVVDKEEERSQLTMSYRQIVNHPSVSPRAMDRRVSTHLFINSQF